jgi:hypothetical protein
VAGERGDNPFARFAIGYDDLQPAAGTAGPMRNHSSFCSRPGSRSSQIQARRETRTPNPFIQVVNGGGSVGLRGVRNPPESRYPIRWGSMGFGWGVDPELTPDALSCP